MAASTVDSRAITIRGKKGNKNNYPVKNTITSPFLCEWPQLSNEETSLLLQKITSTFSLHAESLAKQRSKGKKKIDADEANTKRAELRSQLALGLNEVTRSLEQGRLRLALVCRSARPALMTNHLMSLSATRDTPVLCLHGLSSTLAPLLKLNVILAVGFKKLTTTDPDAFDELVHYIVAMTPPINVPWIQYKELTLEQLREVVTNSMLRVKTGDKSAEKQKGKGKKKGQGSSGSKAPDHGQAGTSSDSQCQAGGNPDSGASPKAQQEAPIGAQPRNGVVAPEHVQTSDGIQLNADVTSETVALPPEDKSEPQNATVQVGQTAKSQQRTPENPTRKRQLSATPPGLSKKRAKLVLRPDYKPVTVLPVKVIPKDLKDKKRLKKKRKANKKKK